jgi:hypothetical protein
MGGRDSLQLQEELLMHGFSLERRFESFPYAVHMAVEEAIEVWKKGLVISGA